MTPFEIAKEQVRKGVLKTPSVTAGQTPIPYFRYQLGVHRFNLSLMAKGLKFKGVKLKDLKNYYGLKGKSAKDCLTEFEKVVVDYESEQLLLN